MTDAGAGARAAVWRAMAEVFADTRWLPRGVEFQGWDARPDPDAALARPGSNPWEVQTRVLIRGQKAVFVTTIDPGEAGEPGFAAAMREYVGKEVRAVTSGRRWPIPPVAFVAVAVIALAAAFALGVAVGRRSPQDGGQRPPSPRVATITAGGTG